MRCHGGASGETMYERTTNVLSKDRTVAVLLAGAAVALVAMIALSAVPLGDFWAGVSYLTAEASGSNEVALGISIFGVFHTTMHSAIWGAAFGGVAGAAAGIGYGL